MVLAADGLLERDVSWKTGWVLLKRSRQRGIPPLRLIPGSTDGTRNPEL